MSRREKPHVSDVGVHTSPGIKFMVVWQPIALNLCVSWLQVSCVCSCLLCCVVLVYVPIVNASCFLHTRRFVSLCLFPFVYDGLWKKMRDTPIEHVPNMTVLPHIFNFSSPHPNCRQARVVEEPCVFKGSRFHTVEFQRWEGGPETAVELKVRVALLRPAHSGATGKKDHPSHSREVHIPRTSASSGEPPPPSPLPPLSPFLLPYPRRAFQEHPCQRGKEH